MQWYAAISFPAGEPTPEEQAIAIEFLVAELQKKHCSEIRVAPLSWHFATACLYLAAYGKIEMMEFEVLVLDEDGQYARVRCACGSELNLMPDEENICARCPRVYHLTSQDGKPLVSLARSMTVR